MNRNIMMIVVLMVASFTASAEKCDVLGGKITNAANRGAFFDVNGGMRHGGYAVKYPTRAQTVFLQMKQEGFVPGSTITFAGDKTENGMCQPVGKVTVVGHDK